MKKDIDCQVFEDQIDAFSRGALSNEGLEQLRLHARSCPDCAMQLRVQEHLALPSLEEVEVAVPDEILASIWPGIQDELAKRKPERALLFLGGHRPAWVRPLMVAATIIWAVGTTVLFAELRRVEAREEALIQQLAAREAGSEAQERAAALASSSPWLRSVLRQRSLNVEELKEGLRSLPGNTVVLDATQIDALVSHRSLTRSVGLRAALMELDGGDGVSARELLRFLEAINVRPDTTVPTSRLMQALD